MTSTSDDELVGCRPRRRSARAEAAILDATVELVAENGVARLTVDGVAAKAGVGKATIYRHWPTKAALVIEAIASHAEVPDPPDTGRLREDLVLLLDGLRSAISAPPLAGLLVSLVDAAERDPELAELHTAFAASRRQRVLAVLQRGVERGELPGWVDRDLAVDLLVGPLFYRRLVSRMPSERSTVDQVVDTVLAGLTHLR